MHQLLLFLWQHPITGTSLSPVHNAVHHLQTNDNFA